MMKKNLFLSLLVATGVVAFECLPSAVEAVGSNESRQIEMYRGADPDVLWVKRSGAELKAGPRSRDEVIAELNKGDQLEVLSKRGTKYQVRTADGKEGYLSRLQITDKKPKSSLGGVTLVTTDDVGPEERSNVRAIRGLTPAAEEYAETADVPPEAVESVIKMEKVSESISDKEVKNFLKEGGVEQ